MGCDLESVHLEHERMWLVGYGPDPWHFPDWRHAPKAGRFDGRWDDPKGSYRVLYSSAERFGAYVEVLAGFRADPAVVAGLNEITVEPGDGHDDVLPAGAVPTSWLRGRAIAEAHVSGRYTQVGHSRSLAYFRRQLASLVVHFRLKDLDAAAIRLHAPREFTQRVSRFVYECTDERGGPQFHGVAYLSRHGDDLANYATFELPDDGARVGPIGATPLDGGDEDLNRALEHPGLVWFDDEARADLTDA
jgi:hypothetical protein